MTTVIVPKTDHKIDGLQFTIKVYSCLQLQFTFIVLQCTYRREAESHVKILSTPRQVIVIQVFISGRTAGEILLHFSDQFLQDLIHLISGKQTRDLKKKITM